MKTLLLILSIIPFIVGCNSVQIKTAKQWEGHYLTVETFKEKTMNITLKENESIWVISNDTMDYILRSR